MSILEFKQLSFGYGSKPIFNDLSFELNTGLTWIMGGDGKGKTSLLQLIANELKPQKGQIVWKPSPNKNLNSSDNDLFWINPNQVQFEKLSALEIWAELRKNYPDWKHDLCLELAEVFSLHPHLAKPVYMLSTGSKRKVWLCAAFASGAKLTLIDEPFAALDLRSQQIVLELLEECIHHTDRAFLVADHLLPTNFAPSKVINLGD